MRLKNKVVLITGAARGIGAATAKRFAQEGATLILTDLHEEALNELKQQLAPGDHSNSTADVTDAAAMNALFEHIDEAYGQIDIVINNAGVTADSTLAKMTEDQWDLVLNVNLKGAFIVGQAAAGYMKKNSSRASSLMRLPSSVFTATLANQIMPLQKAD